MAVFIDIKKNKCYTHFVANKVDTFLVFLYFQINIWIYLLIIMRYTLVLHSKKQINNPEYVYA